MKQKKVMALLLLVMLFVYVSFVFAQADDENIIIGKRVKFNSTVLGRELDIQVYLPQGYENSTFSYPVLYDLNAFFSFTYDCGVLQMFARNSSMPNMILIGLPGLDNGYVPQPFEERGGSPQTADLSLKFFKEELIPFVDKNYRTNRFRVLTGHSVGGLFTMYALFNYPDLFTAYIAGSPWFQNNDGYWLKNIEKFAKHKDLKDKFLFMTVGKQEAELTLDTYKKLESWMNSQSFDGLTWKSARVEGDHGSMVGRNLYDGMLFIFDGWRPPQYFFLNAEVDELRQFMKKTEQKWGKYGFERGAIFPERQINNMGYALLRRQKTEKAIGLFELNVELYPESFNGYDSLAEGYLTAGDKDNAIKYYKKAVELNPGKSDYEKRILKNSSDKLKELGAK